MLFGVWPTRSLPIESERPSPFSPRSWCSRGPGRPGRFVIVVAGLIGWRLLAGSQGDKRASLPTTISRRAAVASLVVFFALLGMLPLLRQVVASQALVVFDSFFRVGSLVFGGGHVVLPLLQAEVVPPGWVTNEEFVAGYGAAQ